MPEVFISYSREDRHWATLLRDALIARGLDVWWDDNLVSGQAFVREIQTRIEASKAVFVLWSRASVASTFVRDEAGLARDLDKLVPVSIDGSKPPLGFGQFHTTDISGWTGDKGSRLITQLATQVAELTQTELLEPVTGGEEKWLKVSSEEARQHPLFGFGGSLLALYLGWIVLMLTQLMMQASSLDQTQFQVENGLMPEVDSSLTMGWAPPLEYVRTTFLASVVQAVLSIPFLVMPLLRQTWVPVAAALGVIVGQALWLLYWLPSVQPLSTVILPQIPPIMITAGVATFLINSERVRITFRSEIRNTLTR